MSNKLLRHTFVKIDLSALRRNYNKIKELTKISVIPVIKANAYGHGAVEVAGALSDEGVDMFGVATIEEGIELRENSVHTPILILGSISPMKNFETVLEYNLTPIIASRVSAKVFEETARRKNKKAVFHFKVDSGMGRIGVGIDTAVQLWNELENSDYIYGEGIFTHLSRADEDSSYTRRQIKDFKKVLNNIRNVPKYVHMANTAGIMNFTESYFNTVRPGLAIYGLYPEGVSREDFEFEPVLSWHSEVIFLKEVKKGTPISYGGRWVAPGGSKIATVCAGYADGFQRALSNKAEVIIRGMRCPVVGRVCMDMIMADVTDIEGVVTGDEVVLIGNSEKEHIPAEEIAKWANTINYEITTGISYRVPRIYIKD